MIHAATQRLIWKEYRAQRGLWLGALGGIFLWVVVMVVALQKSLSQEGAINSSEIRATIQLASILFSFIYSVAFGVSAFGTERENRSAAFLQTMPITAWHAVLVKFLLGISSAMCLFVAPVVLFKLGWDWYGNWWPNLSDLATHVLLFYIFVLIKSILWGFFFSILTGRVLVAVACSTFMTVGIPLARIPLYQYPNSFKFDSPQDFILYPYFDILSVVGLFLLNVAVYRQWSRGELNFRWFQSIGVRRTVISKKTHWKKTPRNSFRSLLWLSRKEVLRASRTPVIVAGAICLIGYLIAASVSFDLSIVIIPFIPIYMGVWVYRENHLRNTNRFYAERGISAGKFWIAKQLVWFPATLLVFMAFLGIDSYFENMFVWERLFIPFGLERGFFRGYNIDFTKNEYDIIDSGLWRFLTAWNVLIVNFHYCLFAYCSAMFCSHWFRRSITAFMAAIIATLPILSWWFFMNWFRLPVFWTVYPIVAAMFFGSFLSTGNWMLERGVFFQRIRTTGLILATFAIVVTGVASFRLITAPEIESSYFDRYLPRQPSEYALETGRMYRRAIELMESNKLIENGSSPFHPGPSRSRTEKERSEILKKLVKESKETIEIALAASKRTDCAMQNPFDEKATPHYGQNRNLTYKLESVLGLLLYYAKTQEAKGKLSEAWRYYLSAMRMCWHLDEHPHERFRINHSEILDRINIWRTHPDQQAEILRTTLEDLKWVPIERTDQRTAEAVALMQIEKAKQHAFEGETDSRTANQEFHELIRRTAAFLLPWEKTRALRMLNVVNSDFAGIRNERRSGYDYLESYPSLKLIPQLHRFLLLPDLRDPLPKIENKKNLLMIRLALTIEKRKTGKYPERLEDLLGIYFDELPYDREFDTSYQCYRNGLPNDLLYEDGTIKAGTPFLFTPLHVLRFFLIKAGDKDNKFGKDYYILATFRPKSDSSAEILVGYASMIDRAIHLIDNADVKPENKTKRENND